MINKIGIGIAVLALILGGVAISKSGIIRETIREVAVGGAAGPDKYNQQNFLDSYTSGGESLNASSTLWIARTITASEFCDNSYIHVNSDATTADFQDASLDLTFPATSTLFSMCLNYPGAEKTIIFRNNSPTAATSTELVAGTGCDPRKSEATGADDLVDGLNEARVTIRRTDAAFQDGGSVDCIMLIEETVVD